MHVRLRHLWENASSGFWFLPSLITLVAALAAVGMLHVDRAYLGSDARIGWLYSGGSDGAKTLLSTVAGSVITVAGVVFSITIAALTQASSQFGPRLLRNFMRDTSNQVVLGTFNATFIYCLLILRTIHGKVQDGQSFVPQASVTGAVFLAVASIAVLIYFIHHVSTLLQAPSIIWAVRADFSKVMDSMADDVVGGASQCAPAIQPDDTESLAVLGIRDGYLQAVDFEALMTEADRADLVLQLHRRAGDYIIAGSRLLSASPANRCAPKFSRLVNAAFLVAGHRTAEQDVEYPIRQIVEVAVRALSPGINDPFTAINCVDALGSVICHVARSGLPGPCHYNKAGQLRLVMPVSTFEGITDTAFNQIRQYGRDSVAVSLRLLEVLGNCAEEIQATDQRKSLLRHADMTYRQSQHPNAIPEKLDRAAVKARWEATSRALGADPACFESR